MTLQEAKFEISKKIKELRALVLERKLELHPDETGAAFQLSFNGYSYLDSFSNDIESDLYPQIVSLIQLCHLNELDIQKRGMLVDSVIESIESGHYVNLYMYDEILEKLDPLQLEHLGSFIKLQEDLKGQIIERLKSDYPASVNGSLSGIAKLNWNGSQTELGELFDQLQKKGWISISGTKASFYRTISTVFSVGESSSLLSNITEYFTKKKFKTGVFSDLPFAKVK